MRAELVNDFAKYKKKAGEILRRDGVLALLTSAATLIITILRDQNLIHTNKKTVDFNFRANQRRIELSETLYSLTSGIVSYGPLSGFKLNRDSNWGKADIGGMLLGLYECEVQAALLNASQRRKFFVDLGAADGFYGVGVVAAGLFKKSYCFEIDEEARAALIETARINSVLDSVVIKSGAESNFYEDIYSDGITSDDLVILSDVEGYEFNIFNADTLAALSKAIIIIEIHDWNGRNQSYEKLKKDSEPYFTISEIRTGVRDLSHIKELRGFYDCDRWILCSEGRGDFGKWLMLSPKA